MTTKMKRLRREVGALQELTQQLSAENYVLRTAMRLRGDSYVSIPEFVALRVCIVLGMNTVEISTPSGGKAILFPSAQGPKTATEFITMIVDQLDILNRGDTP